MQKAEPTLIYERVDNTIYARHAGDPPEKRWVVSEQEKDVIDSVTLRKINDLAREDSRFKSHITMVLKEYGLG